jgi:hypothetical protein
MPLGFHSLNQGEIAFGFFHIETPLLLLDNRVFWCSDFCAAFNQLTLADENEPFRSSIDGHLFHSRAEYGDLQEAIAGVNHDGFIGSLYALIPFPTTREAFVQKTAGQLTNATVLEQVSKFAEAYAMKITAEQDTGLFTFDDVEFEPGTLRQLIEYIWRGGMPGWENGMRPAFLDGYADLWRQSDSPWVTGMPFDANDLGVG